MNIYLAVLYLLRVESQTDRQTKRRHILGGSSQLLFMNDLNMMEFSLLFHLCLHSCLFNCMKCFAVYNDSICLHIYLSE